MKKTLFLLIICFLFVLTKSWSFTLDLDSSKTDTLLSVKQQDTLISYKLVHKEIDFNKEIVFRKYKFKYKNFHIFNDVINYQGINTTTGYFGRAYQRYFFEPNYKIGFNYGENSHEIYLKDYSENEYYITTKPITNILFYYGQREEEHLKISINQNITKTSGIGFKYRVYNNVGFETKHTTKLKNLNFNLYFKSPNNRYAFFSSYNLNLLNNQENGGLNFSRSIIRKQLEDDISESVEPSVRFDSAFFEIKDNQIYTKQILKINESDNSLKQFNISLETDFRGKKFSFKQNNVSKTDLYDSTYDVSKNSSLVTTYFRSNTTIKLYNYIKKNTTKKELLYYLALQNQIFQIDQNIIKKNDINFILKSMFGKDSVFKIKLDYVLDGFNKNNFIMDAFYSKGFFIGKKNKLLNTKIAIYYHNQSQHFKHRLFYSNNFRWNNNFLNNKITKISFSINAPELLKLKIKYNFYRIENYVFLNNKKVPEIDEMPFNVIQLKTFFSIRLYKFFIDNSFIYQYTNNINNIRLPDFYTKTSLYFLGNIYELLKMQIGVDTYYSQQFYANKYSPQLMEFYLQNKNLTGNQIYLDLYITFNYEKALIYFGINNLGYNIINKKNEENYTVPIYPLGKENFTIGIKWKLFE